MNGRISKRIRKKVFGNEGSSRVSRHERHAGSGIVTAGPQRGLYQRAKKLYKQMGIIPERWQIQRRLIDK